MTFNSLAYALFLPSVFLLYWLWGRRGGYRRQNVLLLLASYLFYGWWDWRFCFLILFTTVTTYFCALRPGHRRGWTTLSIVVNLAVLVVFKYFNFFGDNLARLLSTFGVAVDWVTIEILLPVGISFYTFQAVSYAVDTYHRRIAPTRDFTAYALFVVFFPQLVAGPIERSTELLPQFLRPRTWSYSQSVDGLRLILWGLFKKCVVADGVAFWVDSAYANHLGASSLPESVKCLVGVVGFAIQIYGDFSGYSDIAKGSAQLLGIRLMDNFLYPFFSRNALELWHRWHRSLMQWFTEYVYIPLGGSRRGSRYVNVMAVFLLSGLWHGAEMSFVAWGAACGVWYLAAMLLGAAKYRPDRSPEPARTDMLKIVATFLIFVAVFVLFRADNITEAGMMYGAVWRAALPASIFALAFGAAASRWRWINLRNVVAAAALVLLAALAMRPALTLSLLLGFGGFVAAAVMMAVEWRGRAHHFAFGSVLPRRRWARICIYMALYAVILTCVLRTEGEFIYFKF